MSKGNEPAFPETWIKIPDWPQYEVSSYGQVRCLVGPGFAGRGLRHPRYKKATKGKDGYWRVTLHEKRGESRRIETWTIHRLVATCFLDGDNSLDVAHLDGNKDNNLWTNLVWATRKENESHKIAHGTKAIGERNGQSKLCTRAVAAIKKLKKEEQWSQEKIANLFQISQQNVSAILLEKSWPQK